MISIYKTVYDSLKEATANLEALKSEMNELRLKEASGRYTPEAIAKEIHPKAASKRDEIRRNCEAALAEAHKIVEEYKAELRLADALNPSDITEDVKLFQTGVKLNAQDIQAILARNQDNRTMSQLALRYAEENGVDIGNVHYIGHTQELGEAEAINGVIDTFGRWIDKDNAGDMLDKFFEFAPNE